MKVDLIGFTELVSRGWVRHYFNNSPKQFLSAGSITNAWVRHNIEIKITWLEDLLEETNHLQSQNVLPQVVVDFENARYYFDRVV